MEESNQLYERYPKLQPVEDEIKSAFNIMKECYEKGGKVLVCGNGGSSSDSDHIVGELMKGFRLERSISKEFYEQIEEAYGENVASKMSSTLQGALPAISLNGNHALLTAFSNDRDFEFYFAQQVLGLGNKNDVLLCISTSGSSINTVQAARIAKLRGLKVIALTGQKEGLLDPLSDVSIKVPETETYKVQEYHLPIYHELCINLEEHFFKD